MVNVQILLSGLQDNLLRYLRLLLGLLRVDIRPGGLQGHRPRLLDDLRPLSPPQRSSAPASRWPPSPSTFSIFLEAPLEVIDLIPLLSFFLPILCHLPSYLSPSAYLLLSPILCPTYLSLSFTNTVSAHTQTQQETRRRRRDEEKTNLERDEMSKKRDQLKYWAVPMYILYIYPILVRLQQQTTKSLAHKSKWLFKIEPRAYSASGQKSAGCASC